MRIAIVEDDPLCSEQLKQQLEQFSEEQHLFLQIRGYFSGLEFLKHYQHLLSRASPSSQG